MMFLGVMHQIRKLANSEPDCATAKTAPAELPGPSQPSTSFGIGAGTDRADLAAAMAADTDKPSSPTPQM